MKSTKSYVFNESVPLPTPTRQAPIISPQRTTASRRSRNTLDSLGSFNSNTNTKQTSTALERLTEATEQLRKALSYED